MKPEVVSEPMGIGELELRFEWRKVGVMFELIEAIIRFDTCLPPNIFSLEWCYLTDPFLESDFSSCSNTDIFEGLRFFKFFGGIFTFAIFALSSSLFNVNEDFFYYLSCSCFAKCCSTKSLIF